MCSRSGKRCRRSCAASSHRIAAGFVQHENVFAVGDPGAAELDAHAPAQRLGEQQPGGQRIRDEEPADRSRCERPLLPGQAHHRFPSAEPGLGLHNLIESFIRLGAVNHL